MTTSAIALAADYDQLQKLIETGEFSPEDITDTLEGLEGALGDKLDAVMMHARNIEGQARTLGDEARRLTERQRSFEGQVKHLKKYILDCLLKADMNSLKTTKNTFSTRPGVARVIIDNEMLLPDELVDVQTVTTPDKKAIKTAIEQGETVPGTHIGIGERSLQVR
ncbi:siphovirus Gp157 family protein [Xenorhabdus szentirmaii]|uniref:siphovirus Gp157 family protein n=1 Tax=Xenorhabdus szentirmaii TaxID=290112 RepID=UPI0019BDDC4A|nr:siphovirus Gp157 family protein [Xenorhabdus sp. 38]MBD2782422.1 siphovirus Gp157 family protein [Xenorhabdus sp. 38]